jgi:hypothetical protein
LIPAVIVLAGAGAAGAGAFWTLRIYNSAPAISKLKPRKQSRLTKIYAADGTQLGVIHSDVIREPVPGN